MQTVMSRFSVEVFVSQYRKTLQGNPSLLCFRNFPVAKKFEVKRGSITASKNFCLTVPKNFVGEPFSVSLLSGIENFYALEGYVTNFQRKLFVSQFRKIS